MAELPQWLEHVPLQDMLRIDAALEGDWSPTAITAWRPGDDTPDFSGLPRSHPEHRPSLELYFEGSWIGLHCFRREDGRNVFDEERARAVVNYVKERLAESPPR